MKKLILFITLMSVTGEAFAQSEAYKAEMRRMHDKAYASFNMNAFAISHRHIVFLENDNKMIIEMATPDDYDVLADIEKLLKKFREDLAFYKDSLDNLGTDNIRIDYQTSVPTSNVKFRFKRYAANGDMYIKDNNEVSQLKMTQDTIHIKINKVLPDTSLYKRVYSPSRSVLITFLLNNYTDIDDIIAEKDLLQHAIDTMATVVRSRKKRWEWIGSTIFYHPYIKNAQKLWMYDYLAEVIFDMPVLDDYQKHNKVTANLNIGASLLRNKIAPIADAGIEYRRYWQKNRNNYQIFGVYTQPYFLFNKGGDGKFHTYVNWFINAEIGESDDGNNKVAYYTGSRTTTIGLGYLVNPDGVYFQNITMKAFINITFRNGITVSPEVIATDNFKSVYPSLSVKILDIR